MPRDPFKPDNRHFWAECGQCGHGWLARRRYGRADALTRPPGPKNCPQCKRTDWREARVSPDPQNALLTRSQLGANIYKERPRKDGSVRLFVKMGNQRYGSFNTLAEAIACKLELYATMDELHDVAEED